MHYLKAALGAAAVVALLATTHTLAASAETPHGARAIHDSVLVLDSHVDILLPSTPKRYFLPDGGSRASLERLIAGGVDAVVLAVAVGPGPETPAGDAEARQEADEKVRAIKAFVADSGGRAELATSADDIDRIHKAGKIAVILSFLNARSLGGDLANFDHFYQSGVRVAGLNHVGHNAFSDSSRPYDGVAERHHGLSVLGRAAVQRFNDLGVLIDVSQLSSAALSQTLQLTRAPVVATHSDARALVDNARNLNDQELDAIKANGGVVQLTPFSPYVAKRPDGTPPNIQALRVRYGLPPKAKEDFDGAAALPAEKREKFSYELSALQTPATLADYVDQIDYVAKRIGVDHVGIGSDFNHGSGIEGFNDESQAPNVTAELIRRGYTQPQIAAIWGGNFLRVLRAAQAAARP